MAGTEKIGSSMKFNFIGAYPWRRRRDDIPDEY